MGEESRVREIFELALQVKGVDKEEIIWKSFIDFEMWCENYERVQYLYQTLLELYNHTWIHISCALFNYEIKKYSWMRETFQKTLQGIT